MKEYDMQRTGAGEAGDCWVTCIEALLELPQGYLPKPHVEDMKDPDTFNHYGNVVRKFLRSVNVEILCIACQGDFSPRGWCIETRYNSKNHTNINYGHSVIVENGQMRWDPSKVTRLLRTTVGEPLGDVVDWDFLIPIDPSEPFGKYALRENDHGDSERSGQTHS